MISKEHIDRINALARKSRTEGLTPEEKQEQQELRQEYLEAIKAQVRNALENLTARNVGISGHQGKSAGHGCGHDHGPDHPHYH